MTRFWIDFETLQVLGDFPFSTFFGEVHARIIPNFGFHGKGVESLGTFLLLHSLCNLISLFFQSSGAKRSITAEKLQKIIAMTGFVFFFFLSPPFLWGQGDSLWVSHGQREASRVI